MALVVRLREERKWKATRVKLATATIMYVLAMVHLALDVHRATLAFADLAGQSAKLEHYYTQVDDPTHVAKSAIYTVQTMVGESFAIYRVWLVWSWSLLVVLPAILLISTGIIGFIACSQFAHTHSDQGVFSPLLKTWITVFFALALVTSLVSTCLIAGRILWSNHKVRHFCDGGSVQGSNTLASDAILQSSAIYAACLIALVGAYASGSNAQYILLDALQPIIVRGLSGDV
ncbi:hypothetical protein EW026_g4199 [Hermanssonia centrifuga]|uniref:Uncharacterized protein n=1 Tax=Hermanssonia centrifuga TaxID=98765 RepID=A0A4S4KHW3_9APHY|nr:hypothetical protein EW026_g4199 [Hermanssonia centrifuga]